METFKDYLTESPAYNKEEAEKKSKESQKALEKAMKKANELAFKTLVSQAVVYDRARPKEVNYKVVTLKSAQGKFILGVVNVSIYSSYKRCAEAIGKKPMEYEEFQEKSPETFKK